MKLKQKDINIAYLALGNLAYTGVDPEEIGKVMKVRKAMRPHYDAYRAFDEEVRKAQENYDRLVEIETRGEKKTTEDEAWYKEHIGAFVEAVNIATKDELEKEYDIEVEELSADAVAKILSNNHLTPALLLSIGLC